MIRQFTLPEAVARSVPRWLTCLALATALASVGRAQQSAQNAPAPPSQSAAPAAQSSAPAAATTDANTPTIHVGVNEVSLIFTVTDRHGHYVANLNQNDFALLDDQKAPAKVNSFHQ